MNDCKHNNTRIWEPHLAGARKCDDCGWVYNPNRSFSGRPVWFDEEAELADEEKELYQKLHRKYGNQ